MDQYPCDVRFVPKADIPRSRLKGHTFAIWLPTIERFNPQDGREMPRDLLPALALIELAKDRAAIGPDQDARRGWQTLAMKPIDQPIDLAA